MYNNNEFIEIDIINCMSYHFDEIIKIEGFNFDVLIDEKWYENILVYHIS